MSKPGEWNPPMDDYLGELTNEFDDDDLRAKKLFLPDKE